MARYHLNPTSGEPGICRAIRTCPFGDLAAAHYDTKDEARGAYENAMRLAATGALTAVRRAHVESNMRARVRAQAVALASELNDSPDWLPPIDDPAISEDDIDEEDGYISSMEALKDPSISMANCILVAESVEAYCSSKGIPMGVIEQDVAGPELNVHAANLIVDQDGDEWVIDYTYSQVDPTAPWPYIAPREEWATNTRNAGFTSPEEIRKQYEKLQ